MEVAKYKSAYIAAGAIKKSDTAARFFKTLCFERDTPEHLKACKAKECIMFFFKVTGNSGMRATSSFNGMESLQGVTKI